MRAVIEVFDLAESYGRLKALDGVSLKVAGGEIYSPSVPTGLEGPRS